MFQKEDFCLEKMKKFYHGIDLRASFLASRSRTKLIFPITVDLLIGFKTSEFKSVIWLPGFEEYCKEKQLFREMLFLKLGNYSGINCFIKIL